MKLSEDSETHRPLCKVVSLQLDAVSQSVRRPLDETVNDKPVSSNEDSTIDHR